MRRALLATAAVHHYLIRKGLRTSVGLVVESGPMKDWKLLTPAEYGGDLGAGNLVLQVHTTKAAFAIVLSKTTSGDWRATQLAR